MGEVERHDYDVVVIGAGGAGLRAVIEARQRGLRVAVVCKSLFGKAHTVMAEGGCAAAMGNANSRDSWQVHFKDTMRGGKFLNNWRMAELHAREQAELDRARNEAAAKTGKKKSSPKKKSAPKTEADVQQLPQEIELGAEQSVAENQPEQTEQS